MTRDLTASDLKKGAIIREPLHRTRLRLTARSCAGAARGGTGGRWRDKVLLNDWAGTIAPGSFVVLPPDEELLAGYELIEE